MNFMLTENASVTDRDRAAINRENSLKSTGPRTEAGKQISSLNALRHGLTSQVVIMPNEYLEAYHRFTESFHNDHKPSGALETQIVQSIADDYWRLNRAKNMEGHLFALFIHEKAPGIETSNEQVRDALAMANGLREQTKALATLSTHQQRINRTILSNVKLLKELQAERLQREEWQMREAAELYQLHTRENTESKDPVPYNPAKDGFVFSTEEIDSYIQERNRSRRAWSTAFGSKAAA
jgi:hypothetical protein